MVTFYAGQKLRASDLNITPVQEVDASVTDGTTISTSFTNSLTTTGTRGIAFTAGISGKVLVSLSCSGRNSGAAGFVLADFEVRTGSTIGGGSAVRSSDENTCASHQSDSAGQQATLEVPATLVSGLTPGTAYHAVITYRVTGGTGTFNRRKITVQLTF
jgi:hypothetical protein